MTASAGAARAGQALTDRPGPLGGTGVALAVVVAGGLVEGVALGSAQAWPLGRWLTSLRRGRYVLATVLVAGLGWAAASAPAVLGGGDDGGAAPPLALVLLGAAGLGLVMGPVLGSAQAVALRGAAPHPWRWVGANAMAWPGAMCLIFLGASVPGADWPLGALLLDGAVTGAVAGAALGLVTGWFLPSLTGASPHNRVVLDLLPRPGAGDWTAAWSGSRCWAGAPVAASGSPCSTPSTTAAWSSCRATPTGSRGGATSGSPRRRSGCSGAATGCRAAPTCCAPVTRATPRRWRRTGAGGRARTSPDSQIVVRIRYAGPAPGIPDDTRWLSRIACARRLTTQEGLIGFDLGR